jgi:hypothetical protein|tara:strand:- start:35 stop:1489 length:1455 start_codon:yes stop_codon:yes gene_type:complete
MDIFDKLILASADEVQLSIFIKKNNQELYDFLLTQSFTELSKSKSKIENYISSNLRIIRHLDFSLESTIIFTTLLLDVSERFNFRLPFQRLYNLLSNNNCLISNRTEASALFFIGIKRISDYNDRTEEILEKLSVAYINEEDTEDRIIGTIITFYAQVVHNFSSQNSLGVENIKRKLLSFNETYPFLKNDLVSTVLHIDFTNNVFAFTKIHGLLDVFLKRTKTYSSFIRGFLIEENSQYSLLLEKAKPNFNSIRQISVNQWQKINDSSVFFSLQRGVKILTEEKQLYLYLNSYGKMHHSKMISSFAFLPNQIFDCDLNIYDWGCGQGLASISFIDHFKDNIDKIKNITLIEPSELALKRASLHIKRFDKTIDVSTINKDLDSLSTADFENNSNVKIHLFSNILDIDLFSLTQLIELVKMTFKGENYFVCASPYVNPLKTSRLDSFVKSFSTNSNFNSIKEINNRSGEWDNKSWTRVIRIFKAHL